MDDPTVASGDNWDGFPSIEKPTLPFVGPIPGGLKAGKVIQVQGRVAQIANQFSFGLQSGENSIPYADAAFHFNPKLKGTVICNTRVGGEWGDEERYLNPIPFGKGEHFDIVIQCRSEDYKIHVNGKRFTEYSHRLPLENVDYVTFKGDVEIKAIRFGAGPLEDFLKPVGNGTIENNHVQNVPFAQHIPEKLKEGSLIHISGYVPTTAERFSINLQQSQGTIPGVNCILHLNPRFDSKVVCNTMVDEMWGKEEVTNEFPFPRGVDFDLRVECRESGYKVSVNDKFLLEYSHRIAELDRINCVAVDGSVDVRSIKFTQESPSEQQSEEESMEEETSGDHPTTQNIEQDSVSANSIEEQSVDSTKQSEDADMSPPEIASSEQSDAKSADNSAEKEKTGVSQLESTEQKKEGGESSTDGASATAAPAEDDAAAEGEPKKKKPKLDDGGKEEDEDAGEESGAESDDSEQKEGDFDVERILTRRKGPDGDEYLLKWGGWSLYDCTWEPESNVSKGVKRAFNKPIITKNRLIISSDIFYENVQAHLGGGRSEQMKLRIEHDILRNILGESGRPADKKDPTGWKFYNKSDLNAWNLPENWWYRLDKKGHGKQVSFPIKMKVQMDWTPLTFVLDKHRKLIPARRKPLEILLVQMKKRDYSI